MPEDSWKTLAGLFLMGYYLIGVVIPVWIARVKGRNPILWGVFGLLIPPLASLLVAFVRKPHQDHVERFRGIKNRVALIAVIPSLPFILFPLLVIANWGF